MATIVPYLNPIRARSSSINYITNLPRFDSMTHRIDYQRGVTAQKNYYPDWWLGKEIQLEFFSSDSLSNITVSVWRDNIRQYLTPTNITPSGWVSENIYIIKYTPTVAGYYYFTIEDSIEYLTSDIINARLASTYRDLVELKYYDSQNRYYGFFTGDKGTWRPKAYFTGILDEVDGETEQTLYTDEPGTPILLETTESDGLLLTITDVSVIDYKHIKWIRKCDHFYINDVRVTCLEISKENKGNNSDMCDITLRCAYYDNDGFYNYT